MEESVCLPLSCCFCILKRALDRGANSSLTLELIPDIRSLRVLICFSSSFALMISSLLSISASLSSPVCRLFFSDSYFASSCGILSVISLIWCRDWLIISMSSGSLVYTSSSSLTPSIKYISSSSNVSRRFKSITTTLYPSGNISLTYSWLRVVLSRQVFKVDFISI